MNDRDKLNERGAPELQQTRSNACDCID